MLLRLMDRGMLVLSLDSVERWSYSNMLNHGVCNKRFFAIYFVSPFSSCLLRFFECAAVLVNDVEHRIITSCILKRLGSTAFFSLVFIAEMAVHVPTLYVVKLI